jgi:hypothetical protein
MKQRRQRSHFRGGVRPGHGGVQRRAGRASGSEWMRMGSYSVFWIPIDRALFSRPLHTDLIKFIRGFNLTVTKISTWWNWTEHKFRANHRKRAQQTLFQILNIFQHPAKKKLQYNDRKTSHTLAIPWKEKFNNMHMQMQQTTKCSQTPMAIYTQPYRASWRFFFLMLSRIQRQKKQMRNNSSHVHYNFIYE